MEVDSVDGDRYKFSWEVLGYDNGVSKIRSPVFSLNFKVTEWYIELDLSKFQDTECSIPCRLQRVPDIGPVAVTLGVKAIVKLSEDNDFKFEISQEAKIFSEKMENFWDFDIPIPVQKHKQSKSQSSWLSAKNLLIDIEFGYVATTDPVCPKMYWKTSRTVEGLVRDMRRLYEEGYHHDLVLSVGKEKFKLHKSILAARWPKLLSTLKVKESVDEVEVLEFSSIPRIVLTALLRFAYFGDLSFMYHLDEFKKGYRIFSLVRQYNFYRLNDKINHMASECSSSQMLQSYRTSMELKFWNVTAVADEGMGDFKTCDVPLMPRHPPKPAKPMTGMELEKFQRHIRFLNLRVYVDKGPLGYNWLIFSIVLGKIPEKSPVAIQCKLYVVDGDGEQMYLLTVQNLKIDRSNEITFSTPFSKGKISKRYHKVSQPVITWRELVDQSRPFMRNRAVVERSKELIEKDIVFRFELKLADGEYNYDMRHGTCVLKGLRGDDEISNDLELMYNDEKFSDVEVTSGDRRIKTHKAILAARSEVLKAILREKPNLKTLPININPDFLHRFMHYIYTGRILSVPPGKIDYFISVAEEYRMNNLKELLKANQMV